MKRIKDSLLPMILSILGSLAALYQNNPAHIHFPSRDSGVFLYIGWRISHGEVPYRDIWDHKPPLIYFTDALGLSITPDSMWGIWIVQFIFIAATLFVIYKTVEQHLGKLPAVFSLVFLSSGLLSILDRGNVTEEYALLFQALAFWIIFSSSSKDFPLLSTFLIGLAGAAAFFYKQNTIGVCAAYAIFLGLDRIPKKKIKRLFLEYLVLGTGVIILSLCLAAYFSYHSALTDFWEQAFSYNFTYIKKYDLLTRTPVILSKGMALYSSSRILYFALTGWLAGTFIFLTQRHRLSKELRTLFLIVSLNFIIEIYMITISGRTIQHYYLTPLPVMAILCGFLAYWLINGLSKIKLLSGEKQKIAVTLLMLAIVSISQIKQVNDFPDFMRYIRGSSEEIRSEVVHYIDSHTEPEDTVLFINAEAGMNFSSRRAAPTQYVYQFPLALTGKRKMVEEFFSDIRNNKPALIIDTREKNSLSEDLYKSAQRRSPYVTESVEYLETNYQLVARFGKFAIYEYAGTD